jgi:hypothetical protein
MPDSINTHNKQLFVYRISAMPCANHPSSVFIVLVLVKYMVFKPNGLEYRFETAIYGFDFLVWVIDP